MDKNRDRGKDRREVVGEAKQGTRSACEGPLMCDHVPSLHHRNLSVLQNLFFFLFFFVLHFL